MSDDAVDLQVVIPAFNEAEGIEELLATLTRILDDPELGSWRILVVDDHSGDDTFGRVVGLGSRRIACIRLSRNSGSHVALRAGLAHSDAEWVLCMAADGQDDPGAIRALLEQGRRGSDVVWAVRRKREGEPWAYRLGARLFYRFLQRIVRSPNPEIDLDRADFFLLHRCVVEAINRCPERRTTLHGLIAWLGFRQGQVEYTRQARKIGTSRWTMARRIRMGLDWVLAFSEVPMKLITLVGLLVTGGGLLTGLVLVGRALFGAAEVAGWIPLGAGVAVLSGVQMMMLGALGEYLARTFDEARQRPLFFIEKRGPEPR